MLRDWKSVLGLIVILLAAMIAVYFFVAPSTHVPN